MTEDETRTAEGAGVNSARNEDIMPARRAIRSILDYKHPRSRCGIRNGPMLTLKTLDRKLRERGEILDDATLELLDRYGKRKDPAKRETAVVGKDSPNRAAYFADLADLMKQEFETEERYCVTLEDLMVRDENGELEDMYNGQIADLGPFLRDAAKTPASEPTPKSNKRKRG